MSVHLTTSAVLAALLYHYFGWLSLFIIAGGFLIDIDHYFWYIFRSGKLSLKGCYDFYIIPMQKGEYSKHNGAFLIFHTVEALIGMIIFALYSQIAFMILLGLLLHFALDIIHRIAKLKNLFATPPSIVGYVAQLKNKGI